MIRNIIEYTLLSLDGVFEDPKNAVRICNAKFGNIYRWG